MRKTLILLSCLLASTITAQDAAMTLRTVREALEALQLGSWMFVRTAAHGASPRHVERLRQNLVTTNQKALVLIGQLPRGGSPVDLRDSALRFMAVNLAALTEDYGHLVNLQRVAEGSYDAIEAYVTARKLAQQEVYNASESLARAYAAFAAANNLPLQLPDTSVRRKLSHADTVMSHFNRVQMIYFSAYKQEAYLLDALDRNDINAIEQNRNALRKTSADALSGLSRIGSFRNDSSLVSACRRLVQLYADEADPPGSLRHYHVLRENFSKMKESYQAIPRDKRTREEKAAFDEMQRAYSAAADSYSQYRKTADARRSTLLKEYNRTADSFTARHIR